MNRFFFTIILLILPLIIYSQNPLLTIDKEDQKKWVDSIYNSLSIDQKIGQLFTIWVATKEDIFVNHFLENGV